MKHEDMEFLIAYVAKHTGIQLDSSKGYLLRSRLTPVMRAHGIESYDELCKQLRTFRAQALEPDVISAMTTNETSFFRDGLPFEHLVQEVIPRLIEARRETKTLRFWSAACSSGQEPVTLAILLAEYFPELESWDVEIQASDVSPAMVDRCRAAEFSKNELDRGMSAALRDRYFEAQGDRWKALPSVKSMLRVKSVNLIRPFAPTPIFDLILLRNVLIYFNDETRGQICRSIGRVIAPDGFLLLGTAEKPGSSGYERAFGPNVNVFQRVA